MKSLGAVRHQIKQVSFRYLKKRLEIELRPRPTNCTHNRVMRHPKLISAGEGPCGVCVCPQQKGDVLCDKAWGGIEKAKACPYFEPVRSKEDIKDGFKEWLATAQLHDVAAEYPDLAALLWVCQDDAPNREVEIQEEDWEPDEDTEEEFLIDFAGVTLRIASEEDMARVNTELKGMGLAIDAANQQYKTLTTDIAHEREATRCLRADLALQPKVPSPWWHRLFGGGP